MWKDANAVALLTIEKTEKKTYRQESETVRQQQCIQELKKTYEEKPTTEFGALLDNLTSVAYDDRKSFVEEHIVNYERI